MLFVSDNGGAFEANNGILRGGKTDLHEGDIRVAGLARWPEHIKAGTATEIARKGKWKLLAKGGEPVELFDIDSDLTEKHNVFTENPKIAQELQKELKAWLAGPRQQFGNIKNTP